jgi:hypothetical protein
MRFTSNSTTTDLIDAGLNGTWQILPRLSRSRIPRTSLHTTRAKPLDSRAEAQAACQVALLRAGPAITHRAITHRARTRRRLQVSNRSTWKSRWACLPRKFGPMIEMELCGRLPGSSLSTRSSESVNLWEESLGKHPDGERQGCHGTQGQGDWPSRRPLRSSSF